MEAWNFKKLGNAAETALNNGKKTYYFYPNQINLKISVKSKEQWIWSKKKKRAQVSGSQEATKNNQMAPAER